VISIPGVQSELTKNERKWVFYFAVLVMLVTSVPYLVGYAAQGDDWRFTGFVFGVEDGNNYIAKMLRGADGDWLFRTPYSAYDQKGVIAYLPHILLGKLSSSTGQHEQLVSLYHLARFICGVIAIAVMYDFIALFIKDIMLRRVGLAAATLGGGLGWLLVIFGKQEWLGSLPLDFYSPESFGFLIFYGLPHLALARALFLWGLMIYLKAEPTKVYSDLTGKAWWETLQAGAQMGVLWLGVGLLNPLTVVLAWFVVGSHLAILFLGGYWEQHRGGNYDWGIWKAYIHKGIWSLLISSPIVIYTLIAFNLDAFHRGWTAQVVAPAPHPLHYLVAYGLMIPFAIYGARRLLTRLHSQGLLIVVWAVIFPFLAYAPYQLQRRLLEGYWLVLVILFMCVCDGLDIRRTKRIISILILIMPTSLFLLIGGLMAAHQPSEPLFRKIDEVIVYLSLDSVEEREVIVLSSYTTGNALPAWAPVFVVIGHGPESVHLAELTPRVIDFYRPETTDHDRQSLIYEFGVDYVFWGPAEQALGDWNPGEAPYLREVYQQGDYYIFEVLD
jgi:hypothetical protein